MLFSRAKMRTNGLVDLAPGVLFAFAILALATLQVLHSALQGTKSRFAAGWASRVNRVDGLHVLIESLTAAKGSFTIAAFVSTSSTTTGMMLGCLMLMEALLCAKGTITMPTFVVRAKSELITQWYV